MPKSKNIELGLRQNIVQFILLIIVNSFVGGMLGLERFTLPTIAQRIFGSFADSIVFQFVFFFGISKAITNLFTAKIIARLGRKNTLVLGWLIALPIPMLFMTSSTWQGLLLANVFLGLHQGLTWSTTVIMKMDLVGNKNRALAMGLNEFAGYLSIAIFGSLSIYLLDNGISISHVFSIGYLLIGVSLFLVLFFIHDTKAHMISESVIAVQKRLQNPFFDVSWRHKKLFSITHAGLANNLNDGIIWILLPISLLQNLSVNPISIAWLSLYPAVWGIGQLFTGALGDIIQNRKLLTWGMILQSFGLLILSFPMDFTRLIIAQLFLGIGTALVYPNFISGIANITHPLDRSLALSVFRFWRDLGYAFGALVAILLIGVLPIYCIWLGIALYTAFSGLLIWRANNKSNDNCISWQKSIVEIEDAQALLIDVRSPEEYNHFHHHKSVNIPLQNFDAGRFLKLRSVKLYLVCQTGSGRSDKAVEILTNWGFSNTKSICGGMNTYKSK